jgi:predicted metalloprotease with PDZ domain
MKEYRVVKMTTIKYVITLSRDKHTYLVNMLFIATANTHELKLPVWIPGSYMIREFSKNIGQVSISLINNSNNLDNQNNSHNPNNHDNLQTNPQYTDYNCTCVQINKNTWQLNNLVPNAEYGISYAVFAYDFGIRTAYLDDKRGYFNNTSLCMYIVGMEEYQHKIALRGIPEQPTSWHIATQLPKISEYEYVASNYAHLIDSPFELGILTILPFDVTISSVIIPHRLVLSGIIHHNFDSDKLIQDVRKICVAAHQIFIKKNNYKSPFEEYTFLLHLGGDIYTGLEHSESTALLAPYYSLPSSSVLNNDYRKLLSLISHEYFHAWNVKRIKPKSFTPYDLNAENYTKLLWWFEGITSYYDDLILYRAGLISQKEYLQLILDNVNDVYKFDGVNTQTLANSSMTSWIKYYRQDENSPNSIVSYYVKGALVGMCLDILIRSKTNCQTGDTDNTSNIDHTWTPKSLDDVLRGLYEKWLDDGLGVNEHELVELIEQFSACSLKDQIYTFVETVDKLPLTEMLHLVGIKLITKQNQDYLSKGNVIDIINTETKAVTNVITKPSQQSTGAKTFTLGCKLIRDVSGIGFKVQNVYANTLASHAGLAAQDIIIAMDNIKLTDIEKQLSLYNIGDKITLTFFRREQLCSVIIKLDYLGCEVSSLQVIDSDKLAIWLLI